MAEVSQYSLLPGEGEYEVKVGSALITMVEPHVGHEKAYNRWYEDDHFYAGAMAMPWMFAGKRYVAPRDLQALRIPKDSSIANPIELGKYISTYWITDGRYDDHLRWTVATNQRLLADKRVYLDRDPRLHGLPALPRPGLQERRGTARHPRVRLPVQGTRGRGHRRARGLEHRRGRRVHQERAGAGGLRRRRRVGHALHAVPAARGQDGYVKQPDALGRRVTALWFTEGDVRDSWEAGFSGAVEQAAKSGAGKCELVAPFQPTIPGTDTYVDQLR